MPGAMPTLVVGMRIASNNARCHARCHAHACRGHENRAQQRFSGKSPRPADMGTRKASFPRASAHSG
jgi:hypothetical protein